MNLLSRIFRSTPSLRTRVVVATAIGAAIPVLIVGAVVWVGITNDRKERLDRRLDEAGAKELAAKEEKTRTRLAAGERLADINGLDLARFLPRSNS